jgi:hypothetical protein
MLYDMNRNFYIIAESNIKTRAEFGFQIFCKYISISSDANAIASKPLLE